MGINFGETFVCFYDLKMFSIKICVALGIVCSLLYAEDSNWNNGSGLEASPEGLECWEEAVHARMFLVKNRYTGSGYSRIFKD